uniref:Homeobox domain-containing protein n=1 Tax=Ananas comosus var. bracteatus TaxID=296719 RepID=A0A6V7NZD5_ANACO|nr:unnamed protein product [Ananas comosus var. bracteatus]
MASSNRHWPSLFKSKPCNTHQQWQHDINSSALLSGACHKSPIHQERSPEPKPRWNPKPEQIRILEAIFNSGMVNPPRDEIRKIRAQLQEYGQVGDANVFYWFQNRKSRSKHKLRHLHPHPPAASSRSRSQSQSTASSTSSDKSSGASDKTPIASVASVALTTVTDRPTPPPPQMTNQLAPIGHVYYDFGAAAATAEPFFLQGGLGLWSELMMEQEEGEEGCKVNSTANKEEEEEEEEEDGEGKGNKNMELHHFYDIDVATSASNASASASAAVTSAAAAAAASAALAGGGATPVAPAPAGVASPVNEIQQVVSGGGATAITAAVARSTVFINEVAFEVVASPLNLREAFGEHAILLHASGHPVLTDEFGVTLQPLQHGASYYLYGYVWATSAQRKNRPKTAAGRQAAIRRTYRHGQPDQTEVFD